MRAQQPSFMEGRLLVVGAVRRVRYHRRMPTFQLSNIDARLAYIALQYHLGRPGAELAQDSGKPSDESLTDIATELEPQLMQAVATIELSEGQRERLLSAISGSINELKASPLLDAGGKTMLPAFKEALERLFPEVADDPDEALPLAGHMLQLRRRLQSQAHTEAPEQDTSAGRPWWRFWRSDS